MKGSLVLWSKINLTEILYYVQKLSGVSYQYLKSKKDFLLCSKI